MIKIFIVALLVMFVRSQPIQVNTTEGRIEGYKAADGEYYTFHGIRYAESRTGLDMFMPSTRPTSFSDIFYAYNNGMRFAHPSPNGMVGVIDCLVLDVFTNSVSDLKPVIIWLNGEELNPTVSSQYSFKKFVEDDVVVVNLNYRLSVYGFLCLKTEQYSGNAGLKDIILGIEWVHRNIAHFGGNHDNIMLMGHGSAATMAEIITLLPQAKNYVHKAIAFSGSAIAPWAISKNPIDAARSLNSEVGGHIHSLDDMAVFFANRDLERMNEGLNRFQQNTNNTPLFGPCIEDASIDEALLIEDPLEIIRSGNYTDIPYIAGYMTREGTQRASEAVNNRWLEQMNMDLTQFLPVDLYFDEDKETITEEIRHFYFGNESINWHKIDEYLKYHGDTMVVVPMIRGLRERAVTSSSEVRLLEFGFMGTNNSDWDYDEIPLNGTRHGSILNYLFDFDLTSYDESIAFNIVKRITAFAHTGVPVPNITDPVFASWLVFSNETNPKYLSLFGDNVSKWFIQANMMNPQHDTLSFWDRIYEKYYSAGTSSAAELVGVFQVVILSLYILALVK